MAIKILPDEIASQIAAGEVVERPASVVKELLENALDAGATQVTIKVEKAGKRLVEVSDNGSGISAQDLPLAVARHSTSKLNSAEDLFRIVSLGFRGEALASIGSVSRMTITSRDAPAREGTRLLIDGGRSGNIQKVGIPIGTRVRVETLFYNVPARLKFLKSDRTERRRIDELVTRYAVAYPDVSIHLIHDGRTVLHTTGSGDQPEIIAELYGVDVARALLPVNVVYEELSVKGYISPISITRSNRLAITFFVNGRWVKDPSLMAALLQAYHSMIMVGRYPIAVLFLELPPETLDVNVHPAKAEVRFREKDRVFSGLQRAIRRALMSYSAVPELDVEPTWGSPAQSDYPTRTWDLAWDFGRDSGQPDPLTNQDAERGTDERPATQTFLPSTQAPLLRLLGQVGVAYLVAEGPDGLYLIDQHAAHERVLFEKFMSQLPQSIPAQTLLEPVSVHLSAAEATLLEEQLPVLGQVGFQVETFGPQTFLVRAIPQILTGSDPSAALRVLVEEFEEDETPLQQEVEARVIARVCKRSAVKAGQVLSKGEQESLLRDLAACQTPRTCPHGRPTMIHLSVDLLERQFGRRGSR